MSRSRFSLRTLWILMSVVAVALAVFHVTVVRSRQRSAQAVDSLKQLGGQVFLSEEHSWMERPFGTDYRERTVHISLQGNQIDDSVIPVILRFRNLEKLDLVDSEITDTGLRRLQELKKLRVLSLARSRNFGDPGLTHLSHIDTLEVLWLNGTRVSDQGVATLRKLRRLKELALGATLVTDSCLVDINDMPSIERVWVDRTECTKDGCRLLRDRGVEVVGVPEGVAVQGK